MRTQIDPDSQYYEILCIDYSSDYGATFTTHCYDLVPGFDGISENINISRSSFNQNRPNPFSLETSIPFYLAQASEVEILFYDIFGNIVDKFDKKFYSEGNHLIKWSATFRDRERIEPGLYYYEIIVNGIRIGTKKAVKI